MLQIFKGRVNRFQGEGHNALLKNQETSYQAIFLVTTVPHLQGEITSVGVYTETPGPWVGGSCYCGSFSPAEQSRMMEAAVINVLLFRVVFSWLSLIRVAIVISNYSTTKVLTSNSQIIYGREPREAVLQNEWASLKALTSDLVTWIWWEVRGLYKMESGTKNLVLVPPLVLILMSANA